MRASPNQRLDNSVFSLASDLFGFGVIPTKEAVEKDIAIEKIIQASDCKKMRAVYPAIIGDAFSQTMDNYRSFIARYNFRVQQENELIELHNQSVRSFKENNTLDEVQTSFYKLFLNKNKALESKAFNEAVSSFCECYGLILEKRKLITVKYASELVFQNLLHLYHSQLHKRNEQYMRLGVTSDRSLQAFKINSFLVTQLKRNEVNSIRICSKTVRNHRKRLEEAEVFIEYHFAGQQRAVEVHINPEILVVMDLKNSKIIKYDYQQVSLENGKELPDNNENTRTFKNEYKKKENVGNISLVQRSSLPLTPTYFLTGTPTSKEKTNQGGGQNFVHKIPNEKQNTSKSLSEGLRELILHPQELAENLAEHCYNQYKPIDIRYLYKEAYSGTLTRDEFRELAIQDFFKTVSKLWKHSTPFVGSWKKAINLYYQNKWLAFTGDAFNKSVLVEDIQQMRWRIEWARKWFFKNNIPVLFPYDYFDMTRKTSKEIGFEYTKQKWSEHQSASKKYEQYKSKQEANSLRRKEQINYAKKCENEVAKFLKNKTTLPQLFDYVEKNFPKEFLEKLPKMIESKVLQNNQKTIIVYDYSQFDMDLKTY